ncbi:hypothetical protein DEO72_LG8g941 [Vigna unguiculata]|uniref:Uncharacterized protein n=1 Tax=Vigna unguiculata TaxID=3917 RepID=A0A4D6MSS5_VIGUN|nr:hypothetical protein DEO72_LG8g941 [Vigna unguiculata]
MSSSSAYYLSSRHSDSEEEGTMSDSLCSHSVQRDDEDSVGAEEFSALRHPGYEWVDPRVKLPLSRFSKSATIVDFHIMATAGPSGKEVFLELRRKKLEEEKRKGGESASRVPGETTSQKGDLMPHAAAKKKGKRRDCTARPSTPRSSSPKKSRGTSSADGAADALSSMAMVMGHHLNTVLSQLLETSKLAADIESLQRDLAEANSRRQEVSLQLGSVKNERSQLLAERNILKARCRDFEKKDEDSQAALEELAVEKRDNTEKAGRIYQLEGYVMSQHEEGFHKALRHAAHYFNFDAGDGRFNIDEDVYQGSVMAMENIPVVGQPTASPEE